ncbi:MAG: nodulation protein NfeD [Dokdonella sp.]|nr:nodulation protein NfeD [Dokdonella sp.]
MTRWIRSFCCTLLAMIAGVASLASAAATDAQPPANPVVAEIHLEGPIGPAAAEYFEQASRRAEADGATAIVLHLDTPGGLAESMRQIVSRILAAKLPVLGYVAPAGARAASAGTYILYACQVAAMAPATHLGAATPVSLGGVMPEPGEKPDSGDADKHGASAEQPAGSAETRKVRNDAVAYIRSLAELRQRNADWAEAAVRDAATLTASEALKQGVIEIVASDVPDLLAQANGRNVRVGEQALTLRLANATVRAYEPNWRSRFLAVITNPTFAYLLLLAGLYGLVLEALHPGSFFPGIVGGICLLVGLYALQLLPVNYAGLALMGLGIGLLIAEVVAPGVGALGIGGVVSFVFGSILLFDTDVPGFAVNLGVIAGIAFCAIALLALLTWLVLRARRAPRIGGDALMLGVGGELLGAVAAGGEGWARVLGERWRVHCDQPMPAGARIRVVRREGLQLWVIPE